MSPTRGRGSATSLRVYLIGSGSGGNATFFSTGRTRILVDAGFSCRRITNSLRAIGEDPAQLDAVLISHEHSDHISGLPQLLKVNSKVPVFVTERCDNAIDWKHGRPIIERFEAGKRITIGDIEIDTFTIPHDAVDPVGFSVRNNGTKVSLVTDLGYMPDSVKFQIRGAQMLVLESNHDLDMLKVGPYPWFIKQRVMSRVGHLSNHTASEFLSTEFDRAAEILVLAHLSGNNNHPEIARMTAQAALDQTGARHTRLLVASQHTPSEVFEL